MKSKSLVLGSFLMLSVFVFIACVDKKPTSNESLDTRALTSNQAEVHGTEIKPGEIQLTHPLNADWVKDGKAIYDLKCSACHKLTNEELVGPGWSGVTHSR